MNKNTFQSQRNHTRVKFEPLTVSCSLVCLTPQSPATQSINTTLTPIEYEPDRAVSPTVIFPDVRANDIDNVFKHGSANEYLSLDTLKWQVDGKDIEKVWKVGTDYEIVTDASDTRGALRVKKNLAANEKAGLRFFGDFFDWRTGIVYKVESDEMALTCTDKGENAMQCHVDKPLIEYDPLFDDLLLYDYKVANNIPVQGSRESYKNGKSFEQTINIVLTDGTTECATLPDGISMRLVKVGSTSPSPIEANSEANPEVTEISFPNISFDMRLVSKEEYSVQFLKNAKVVASATIGLHTNTTMPTFGKPAYGSDIAASQTEYFNSVMLNLSDRMVEYPELYYLIEWFTQAKYNDNGTWKYAAEKTWQRGINMDAAVADLGIGITHNDSYFDIWFDVNPHHACELVADEDNDVLTDEEGVMLID